MPQSLETQVQNLLKELCPNNFVRAFPIREKKKDKEKGSIRYGFKDFNLSRKFPHLFRRDKAYLEIEIVPHSDDLDFFEVRPVFSLQARRQDLEIPLMFDLAREISGIFLPDKKLATLDDYIFVPEDQETDFITEFVHKVGEHDGVDAFMTYPAIIHFHEKMSNGLYVFNAAEFHIPTEYVESLGDSRLSEYQERFYDALNCSKLLRRIHSKETSKSDPIPKEIEEFAERTVAVYRQLHDKSLCCKIETISNGARYRLDFISSKLAEKDPRIFSPALPFYSIDLEQNPSNDSFTVRQHFNFGGHHVKKVKPNVDHTVDSITSAHLLSVSLGLNFPDFDINDPQRDFSAEDNSRIHHGIIFQGESIHKYSGSRLSLPNHWSKELELYEDSMRFNLNRFYEFFL